MNGKITPTIISISPHVRWKRSSTQVPRNAPVVERTNGALCRTGHSWLIPNHSLSPLSPPKGQVYRDTKSCPSPLLDRICAGIIACATWSFQSFTPHHATPPHSPICVRIADPSVTAVNTSTRPFQTPLIHTASTATSANSSTCADHHGGLRLLYRVCGHSPLTASRSRPHSSMVIYGIRSEHSFG